MQLKKYKPGKQERSEGRYCENIVKPQFRLGRMNEIWAGDITYLKTKLGWVYLAIVMDLFSREVIGYAVSRKMNAELTCRALMNAVARNGKPKSLVFHSDRGSQYSSRMVQQMLEEYGIKGSMSKPGYPYENSCGKSLLQKRIRYK